MLIPDNITEFESNGEKLMYFNFKNDGSARNMYVLHSVFTNYHLQNVSGELDFLVLAPGMGIFAIEVKHGRVARKDGVWEFTNKKGKTTKKTKSPFAQVSHTMHSLRNFIVNKVKDNQKQREKLSNLLWGTGVAFTSFEYLPDVGQEAESWQIFIKEGLRMKIGQYINSLSIGFHNKFSGKPWYDSNESRPTRKDCEMIIQIIRGDFDTSYTDLNKLRESDQLIEEFTKEQFQLLDITNYNDRCLFEGAAGTGKTLLALELFRRKVERNLKIGLFCYNRKLGKHLSFLTEKLKTKSNYYAGSLHGYLLQNTDINISKYDHNFFSEELPFEFLLQKEDLSNEEKFDFLVIDEAQDLITPYYLEVFDHVLKGGLKKGLWTFFGDFSNQAIFLNQSQQDLFSLLKQKSDFVNLPPLKVNCRNTKVIARQNTLLTGTKFPEFLHGGLQGKPIVQRFPAKGSYILVIEKIVRELQETGIPVSDIILLAPRKFDSSTLGSSEFIKKLFGDGLSFSTIQAYKGLEKNIVIIYDFNELASGHAQCLLYVALSRARQMLYIVLDNNLEKEYNQLIQNNLSKLD
ncbi:MAG: NERD domain-containing protein/DEAD/DEAH box helicase [Lewinellaceae bacterium]|nr:NERD domain-containing protein/DEAD/DEAH box helicase [Lewinellaceae bacterium]